MLQKLSKIKTDNNDSLIYEIGDDGKPIVEVMTPFMKRVHRKINHSSEIVFMDSTGGFDSLQHRVFILMTHSYMGALPLGLVITTTEKADSIAKGLRLLLKLMSPDEVFYGKKTPAMILTDNSAAERSALRSVFPGAILLLCIFHILQAVWRYLWKAENHVEKSDKNNLFNMFKKLLYSKTEADLNAQYKFIIDHKVTQKYPKVLNYYMELWAQKADWALCFRNTLLTRQNNTNNYAEATMRVLKDKIFHRTRAYNIIQLIDFLVTKIDPYYERKLLNFAAGRNIQTHLQARYSLDVLNKKAESFEIHGSQDNDAVFKVKNLTKNTEYVVNLELEMCTCFVGNTGGPCKHQAAVLVEKKSNTMNFFVGDEDQRRFIHELATGKTVPSNFYAKLSDLPSDNQQQVEVLPVVGEKRSTDTEEQMDIDCSVSTTSAPILAVPTLRDITNITTATPSTTATAINIDDDDDDADDELFMPTFDVQLKKFCNTLTQFSKSEEGATACKQFFNNFSHLKTSSSLSHALCTFGKDGKIKPRLRGSTISVQPTSKCRRLRTLGGNAPIVKGRPPKKIELKENVNFATQSQHDYLRTSRKKKAPHCLAFCVQENMGLPAT
ncbi:uncharacterized protein LOC135839111 [Planococcus citri]|uniref:uncharacterized protein LOC135839111 n=1 Tax=Planococcus citri TaxID=170843 RepID=UPI0031F7CF5B